MIDITLNQNDMLEGQGEGEKKLPYYVGEDLYFIVMENNVTPVVEKGTIICALPHLDYKSKHSLSSGGPTDYFFNVKSILNPRGDTKVQSDPTLFFYNIEQVKQYCLKNKIEVKFGYSVLPEFNN